MVFPRHYCSCQAFFYDVVCHGNALSVSRLGGVPPSCSPEFLQSYFTIPHAIGYPCLQCKHQLAARLAPTLNKCHTHRVSDLEMANMLMRCPT